MVYGASNNPWEYIELWNTTTPEGRPLNSVGDFLGLGINIVLGVSLAISMISLIMSGIKYITAKSDPKATSSAQQAITYSVLAFVLTIAAFTIKTILFNVMGGDFGDLRNATPGF
jgi:hypothetical protein